VCDDVVDLLDKIIMVEREADVARAVLFACRYDICVSLERSTRRSSTADWCFVFGLTAE